MGLISWTVGLPLMPIRGVFWISELIQQRAEQELRDPRVARNQLEALEVAARSGDLTPEAQAEAEQQVVKRMVRTTGAGAEPEVEA